MHVFYRSALILPCCFQQALHLGAQQGFFWYIPVIQARLLLVFAQDTISEGEVLFILPCEYIYEKHVYCTSGLLTH